MIDSDLRISTPDVEVSMQASKWLTCPALIDGDEMEALLNTLGAFQIYMTSCVTKRNLGRVDPQEFLSAYRTYIQTLQSGQLPDDTQYRHLFSSVFTVTPDALFAVLVGDTEQLVRVAQPIVQLQPHRMGYSTADGKFRSKTFGSDSITWGIQFSYPQLYKDSITHEIHEVDMAPQFPNTILFRTIQKWVRHHTIPTPFLVGDQHTNVPMRIGKNCLPWINRHPQLIEQGIQVRTHDGNRDHSNRE